MADNLNNDSITSKIKKLLALADGNQNEHEREVAMKHAMDLLAKHNLTIESLSVDAGESGITEFEADFRLEPWIRVILDAACTLYYTDFYISSKIVSQKIDLWTFNVRPVKKDNPVFVGTSENIAVTIEVATWLIASVRAESNRVYKDSKERRSFRVGAADSLYERARQFVAQERAAESASKAPGTSLMVMRNKLKAANRTYLDSLHLQPVSYRSTRVNISAYEAGTEFGDRVELNPGVRADKIQPKQLAVK